jgi:hypothetical protein
MTTVRSWNRFVLHSSGGDGVRVRENLRGSSIASSKARPQTNEQCESSADQRWTQFARNAKRSDAIGSDVIRIGRVRHTIAHTFARLASSGRSSRHVTVHFRLDVEAARTVHASSVGRSSLKQIRRTTWIGAIRTQDIGSVRFRRHARKSESTAKSVSRPLGL